MLAHYLQLALRSVARHRALTALMVLALAIGIGAAMTTLTVFHVLAGDPLPGRSDKLFLVQLDPTPASETDGDGEPPDQLTRYDAEALLREKHAPRQAAMTGGTVAVQPERAELPAFYTDARYTSADFFAMFGVPFAQGAGWNAAEDEARERVVVITRALAEKLYGTTAVVGRTIRLSAHDFRILGVLGDWRPVPHFYDLNIGQYADSEQVFLPYATSRELRLSRQGSLNCWEHGGGGDLVGVNAKCVWIQYWVQLDTPAQAAEYRRYLVDYSERQRAAGRFERAPNVRLRDVMAHLEHQRVVPEDVKLQTWLAFGFLAVCLVNTVGLLLAKCLRRAPEIGVRRALGASRRQIFVQFLVEAGVLGLVGGVLGLGLALLGLWAVRANVTSFAGIVHLDLAMLATTFALAIGASLVAGLLPAWRACQVTPALQLKSQ